MAQAIPLVPSDYLVRLLSNLTTSERADQVSVDDANLLLAIGEAYTALARVKLAELGDTSPDSADEHYGFAKALLKGRRDREGRLGQAIFGEPAWDILLELYVLQAERLTPSVSAIGFGVVPQTTALRCLDRLSDRGLISRVPDDQDARRTKIELTDRANAGVRSSLEVIFASSTVSRCDQSRCK